MAKLSKLVSNKPIALSVDGMFVRNLPAKVVQEKFGNINEDLAKDQEAVIVSLFTELLCDENGDVFEDCGSFDEITSILSVVDIHRIVLAIPEAISPSAVNAGK
tara:strand:+ start:2548 stop:2859 length:312 start_codon:yes stop_codon:yes gene_type:complete